MGAFALFVSSGVLFTPASAQDVEAQCPAGYVQDYDPCLPAGPDLNCGDLDFSVTVRVPGQDVFGLDRDEDGRACEANGDPGPDVPRPTPHTCNGEVATLVGTAGDDVLRGTDGVDVIVGLGGDDRIYGYNGGDIICGGEGKDRIFGGKRADIIFGGPGPDRINGDVGADQLTGDEGNDRILGGQGDDILDGGRGKRDRLFAGPGTDSCTDAQANTRRTDCES